MVICVFSIVRYRAKHTLKYNTVICSTKFDITEQYRTVNNSKYSKLCFLEPSCCNFTVADLSHPIYSGHWLIDMSHLFGFLNNQQGLTQHSPMANRYFLLATVHCLLSKMYCLMLVNISYFTTLL